MKLKSLFRRKKATLSGAPAARMTWAQSRAGRSLSQTRMFLKKQIWMWPLIAGVLLATIGLGMRTSIEKTMKANLHSGLKTLLDVEKAMLLTWFQVQESNAVNLANDLEVRNQIYALIEAEDLGAAPDPEKSVETLRQELTRSLSPSLTAHNFGGYFVAGKNGTILAASELPLLEQKRIEEYSHFLRRSMEGETLVTPPFSSVVPVKDSHGKLRAGEPVMYVCAPIRDARFQVIASLALRIRPEGEFTRILNLGQVGDTGETYAFNKAGLMVSNSRFDEELILLGLLPDEPGSRSLLHLSIRNPGGNMMAGYRPGVRRNQLPLTVMAADAIAGNTSENVEGYNNYRGVPVVGAWTWLPKYELGLATEIDLAQAYKPLMIIQRVFWGLFTLLAAAALAIFVFMIISARLRREAQNAAIAAQQLGQYTLEKKIGAGAMGQVYRAYHAMLRRPTAVKLLNLDLVNENSVARFEREVQITCQLNNPHTVAIYDYGRTPEGVFYYAMEYLDGIDLQTLVEKYGPQPEARVIHILLQICSSLYEAHLLDLVHRDIKPANIMLNRRGGESDVVKVLDFGLVKALDEGKQASMTSAGSMTGTPLYMSPEAIQFPSSVDLRSDLYAVGAVGSILLTGQPTFQATNVMDLLNQHVSLQPVPPSSRSPHPVSEAMDEAILACLEKSRIKRPQSARDLAQLLRRSPQADAWTQEDSDAWWSRHERGMNIDSTRIGQQNNTVADAPQTQGSPATSPAEGSSGMDQTFIP